MPIRGRRADGVRQIALGLGVFAVYLAVTHGFAPDVSAAAQRGRWLLRLERDLHLDVERGVNHWLSPHHVLGWLAAWEYAVTYIVTTFAVLAWVWWRRSGHYRWARNTLLWSTLLAIVSFVLWPTAPPRLLPGTGFIDVVARHHPILSWGGGAVSAGADQYAAMPSLHVGWAVWVTLVVLRVGSGALGHALAILHLLVTALVVVATGNHYLLDVVAGFVLVAVAVALEAALHRLAPIRGRPGERVAAADEFFLHVETARNPQPVGGFVMLDVTAADRVPDLDDVRRLVAERLPRMPRFSSRLQPATRWRHARWLPAEPDLYWHVREHRLPPDSGRTGLYDFVAGLCEQRFDPDRPPWRLWYVPQVGPGEAALIGVLHHAVADGLGVVDTLRQLFDPDLPLPDLSGLARPSVAVRAAATAAGVLQLAADGSADRLPFTGPSSGRRAYRVTDLDFAQVRAVAAGAGVTVTDILLAAVGTALHPVLRARGQGTHRRLRAAVPITTRIPAPAATGWRAEPGNRTAALRLDVPLAPMPVLERLRGTAAAFAGRRRSGRALATAAVMRAIGLLPPGLHLRAARAMYCHRFLGAIVSNMPGPSVPLSFAGLPIGDTYPILPLADGVALGVGTLGWNGRFCVSVLTDAGLLPEADELAVGIRDAIEQLAAELGSGSDAALDATGTAR